MLFKSAHALVDLASCGGTHCKALVAHGVEDVHLHCVSDELGLSTPNPRSSLATHCPEPWTDRPGKSS